MSVLTPEEFEKTVQKLPTSLSLSDVSSKSLAYLFSHPLSKPRLFEKSLLNFQERLLDLTIRMAIENVPYYRQHIRKKDNYFWNQEALLELPTLSRDTAFLARKELISPITSFGFVSFTGGSTGKPPLLIERSQEEQKYLSNFFTYLQKPYLTQKSNKAPLGLVSQTFLHGKTLSIPCYGYSFIVTLNQEIGFVRSKYLLESNFEFEGYEQRISSISSSAQNVYTLYKYLRENEVAPFKGQIKSVICCSDPIPLNRRTEMENYFGVKVQDTYSLSEMFGGARYCHDCDAYHFDPFVVPEVLDLKTSKRIYKGSGELVLTPLFPFTQRFSLIRYQTSDMVEISPTDCNRGSWGFRFRGRLQNCVGLSIGDVYVCAGEIAKALDKFEELNRHKGFLSILSDPSVTQFPIFSLSCDSELIEVRIECKSPYKNILDITEIKNAILKQLPLKERDWFSKNPERLSIHIVQQNTISSKIAQHLL